MPDTKYNVNNNKTILIITYCSTNNTCNEFTRSFTCYILVNANLYVNRPRKNWTKTIPSLQLLGNRKCKSKHLLR